MVSLREYQNIPINSGIEIVEYSVMRILRRDNVSGYTVFGDMDLGCNHRNQSFLKLVLDRDTHFHTIFVTAYDSGLNGKAYRTSASRRTF